MDWVRRLGEIGRQTCTAFADIFGIYMCSNRINQKTTSKMIKPPVISLFQPLQKFLVSTCAQVESKSKDYFEANHSSCSSPSFLCIELSALEGTKHYINM